MPPWKQSIGTVLVHWATSFPREPNDSMTRLLKRRLFVPLLPLGFVQEQSQGFVIGASGDTIISLVLGCADESQRRWICGAD